MDRVAGSDEGPHRRALRPVEELSRRCRRLGRRGRLGAGKRPDVVTVAPHSDRVVGAETSRRGENVGRRRARGQDCSKGSLKPARCSARGAALRTGTVLVDEVLRPALGGETVCRPGGPSASCVHRSGRGARVIVSLPKCWRLVISGAVGRDGTAALRGCEGRAERRSGHGSRHAEGGGRLSLHAAADPAQKAAALAEASSKTHTKTRLGRVLQTGSSGCIVDDEGQVARAFSTGLGIARARGPRRISGHALGGKRRGAHLVRPREAGRLARTRVAIAQNRGGRRFSAASIVTRTSRRRQRFPHSYRGYAGVRNATNALSPTVHGVDRLAWETGINVDRVAGRAGR